MTKIEIGKRYKFSLEYSEFVLNNFTLSNYDNSVVSNEDGSALSINNISKRYPYIIVDATVSNILFHNEVVIIRIKDYITCV